MAKNYLSSSIMKETIERNKSIVGTLLGYCPDLTQLNYITQDGSSAPALVKTSPACLHSDQTVPLRLHHHHGGLCPPGLRPQLQHHGAARKQDGFRHHTTRLQAGRTDPKMCLLQVRDGVDWQTITITMSFQVSSHLGLANNGLHRQDRGQPLEMHPVLLGKTLITCWINCH